MEGQVLAMIEDKFSEIYEDLSQGLVIKFLTLILFIFRKIVLKFRG